MWSWESWCKILSLFYPSKKFAFLAFGVVTDASSSCVCFLYQFLSSVGFGNFKTDEVKLRFLFDSLMIASTYSNRNACKVSDAVLCLLFWVILIWWFQLNAVEKFLQFLRRFCRAVGFSHWDVELMKFISSQDLNLSDDWILIVTFFIFPTVVFALVIYFLDVVMKFIINWFSSSLDCLWLLVLSNCHLFSFLQVHYKKITKGFWNCGCNVKRHLHSTFSGCFLFVWWSLNFVKSYSISVCTCSELQNETMEVVVL